MSRRTNEIKEPKNKNKGGHFWPPFSGFGLANVKKFSDTLDVFCLPALWAFYHVKLNLLSFLKAAESARLNGGEMHEDIFPVLAADKSVPLGVVKPLHCSCFHVDAMFLFLM